MTKYDLFDLKNFNVIEDENYYYVFRALNKADHEDIIDSFLETNNDPKRIRTATGKIYNKNYFDIDGYWYKKSGEQYIKTDSKYDEQGLDINRRDKYGFTKNGYYKNTSKKTNEAGFYSNGIHCLTGKTYNLEGLTIDGNLSKDIDWKLIDEVKKTLSFERRKYIEEVIKECDDYKDLLETYNEETGEFEEVFGELEEFIKMIITTCIKPNDELYTEEEVYEYLKQNAKEMKQVSRNEEIEEIYDMMFERMIDDGDVPFADKIDMQRVY